MSLDSALKFKEVVITAEKERLGRLLAAFSDQSSRNLIDTFKQSLIKQEEIYDRAIANAEKFKDIPDLYDRYLESAQHMYESNTKDIKHKLGELEKKINISI